MGSCSCDVPLPEGGWRRPTMALVPGLVAVLRIISRGNKVALGETVRRVLSSSSAPPHSLWQRRCQKKACEESIPLDPCGLGAVPRIPSSPAVAPARAWCLSSSLAPPQDRENCHVGGNGFVSFDGFAPVTLCNLYLHRAIKSPFLFYGKYDRGYRDIQRVTGLEYV